MNNFRNYLQSVLQAYLPINECMKCFFRCRDKGRKEYEIEFATISAGVSGLKDREKENVIADCRNRNVKLEQTKKRTMRFALMTLKTCKTKIMLNCVITIH